MALSKVLMSLGLTRGTDSSSCSPLGPLPSGDVPMLTAHCGCGSLCRARRKPVNVGLTSGAVRQEIGLPSGWAGVATFIDVLFECSLWHLRWCLG